MSNRVTRFGAFSEGFAKLMLISLVFFVVFANVPAIFLGGDFWLQNTFGIAFAFVTLLYLGGVAIRHYQRPAPNFEPSIVNLTNPVALKQQHLSHFHLGIFGGLIGICAAGLLMYFVSLTIQDCPVYLFAVCGGMGGVGFGALTGGNIKLRGIIGCAFGLVAIGFGLMLSYSSPIVVGYTRALTEEAMSPIYLLDNYTFGEFATTYLFSLNGLFFSYIGLVAAYLGSSKTFFYSKTKSGAP